MSDTAPLPSETAAPATAPALGRSRVALFKRLADVVCLPSSRVNAFERSMTADLLDCAKRGTTDHRRLIALRRGLSDVISEALIEGMEPTVIEALLRNELAKLTNTAVETMVAATRDEPQFIPLLLRRSEMRPHHAYTMFWWADSEARRQILQRFAVSREVLQEAAADVFTLAAQENWQDPVSRKALQFIERRQRNRQAIARSRFGSLEEAVAAGRPGLTRETAEEISYLSGLKPMTGAKIFTDAGGEPLAILCKATGLPRAAVRALWQSLRRPETDAAGQPSPALERCLLIYDMIAVDRAQTVLRYWNWSLSSAITPALLQAIRDGDREAVDDYSAPQQAAMLVLQRDLAR